ncbi:uncharacterized protein CANTADRAFT_43445 [Suhomyces tanzawaensis NRRL Y-17324]|uniref:CAP-Gly domain-containing protein n=1 Tax=Suhomyces tanzawaensis NRRL Y-17324 TaxID=984487 RepID=A0A1E4SRV9_9ASCO|nr:uncharacterized protein CANTADRAFT_43445 [Suhomyces tanzawaensis NRRL Y-17324]ODV82157.1 hypothetical protein CANTADRAFT_43445 [Suhomyces tanzawaensis NRRL Y-17324]
MADINVYITSNITSSERRISPQWDLHYLKSRLELITGVPPQYQTIQYYPLPNSNDNKVISDAEDYSEARDKAQTVAHLNIVPLSRLHVIDTNPDSELAHLEEDNEGEDFGFKLSEEEYAKKSGTVLSWKQRNQLGRFNPEFQEQKARQQEEHLEASKSLEVGKRCRIITISSERRGIIRYVGKIETLDQGESVWVGVEFDEPVGKNNGTIDGVRVFECRDKHGSFVRPKQVEVGDFPELDPFDSDDEM